GRGRRRRRRDRRARPVPGSAGEGMIIRGGSVVTARSVEKADVAIAGGTITAVGPNVSGPGEEVDATGLHVFPGGIDSHVHFNEPGRTDWEDIAHGSAALAAGGY